MKKILVLFILSQLCLFAAIDTARIDSIFNSVGKRRIGLSSQLIDSIQTPFVKISNVMDQDMPTVQTYTLYAVFGKSAKINDGWYTAGDHIGAYTIKDVKRDYVVMVNDNKEQRILKFKEGNSNVKIEVK